MSSLTKFLKKTYVIEKETCINRSLLPKPKGAICFIFKIKQKVSNELNFIFRYFFHFNRKVSNELNSICRSNQYLEIEYSICRSNQYLEIEYLICRSNYFLEIEYSICRSNYYLEIEYSICRSNQYLEIEFYDPMMQQEAQR